MNIAVVVPTIESRKEIFDKFMYRWQPYFVLHEVRFITVLDGDKPKVRCDDQPWMTPKEVMGKYESCLSNFNAGIRNLGFAYIAKYLPEVDMILTLDDDCLPVKNPIQDHIDALNMRVPTSWMSTAVGEYMRGFPYNIRNEAEVVLSHGVWEGVADWDAPNQLINGSYRPVEFYKGPIPNGVLFPVCAMNMAFKPKLLPYIFQAPWALGIHRFDDIFAGITAKRAIDTEGWAAVSGYARIHHDRASDVFTNLKNEAPGIELNETYFLGNEDHEYFKIYKEKLNTWQSYLKTLQ